MSAENGQIEGISGLRVGLLGATGTIGTPLGEALEAAGAELVRFSREVEGRSGRWRSSEGSLDLSGLDAVVNLAGESVAQRWSASVRKRIEESRVGLSKRIVAALEALPAEERPASFLSGSAVGFYGARGEEELVEGAGVGEGYLAKVCQDWEEEAGRAVQLGVRVVFLRTGVVLGRGGEAWSRLSRVFRWGLGGVLGSGEQWMSWIHLDDEVAAILLALREGSLSGPVNLVSPNREFTRTLAKALRRPAIFRVPGWALRLGLGGFAESLLGSQRVLPSALEGAGFVFRHATFQEALEELVG